MARFDIMPYDSHHLSHEVAHHFQMGGGTTSTGEDTSWRTGNVLVVDDAVGDINPHVDGTLVPSGITYLAAADSEALINLNGGTSGATTHKIMVPVYDLMDGTEYVTANVYNGSDTELDLDTGFQIGDTFDIWVDDAVTTVDGHKHGLDLAGTIFTVTKKLDALGRNSLISGAATVAVVFRKVG